MFRRQISRQLLPIAYVSKLTTLPIPALRNIVIVGHSPKGDLNILQRLGVNLYEIAPILTVLDMHLMARNLFKVNTIFLNGTALITSFNLGALLVELK
jgi:hypothetical protein